jgi:signal transduction histidine kinase
VRAQLAEVRASRARIVEAADAERRRIERDLHDGAQQRLLALATRLQTAKATAQGAGDLVDEATTELEAAVSEVRELARGLHPQILTDLGLGPALEALAERAAIPVEVRAPDRRYPVAVETAAYFLVSEALTNVARHAEATGAVVTVSHQDDRLTVEIADDGSGGADVRRGTGLRGLVDRVAASGGSLTIDSQLGKGTAVRAAFPL